MQKQKTESSEYVKKGEGENDIQDQQNTQETQQGTHETDPKPNPKPRRTGKKSGKQNETSPSKVKIDSQEHQTQNKKFKTEKLPKEKAWKEELKNTLTLETKIPAYPSKDELLELREG